MRKLTILMTAAVIHYAVLDYPDAVLEGWREFGVEDTAGAEMDEPVGAETSVSSGDGIDGTASQAGTVTGAEATLQEEKTGDISQAVHDNIIYHVAFPTGVTAWLDPGNLTGKGQIFSDEYEIENYGNTDVAIKINRIGISYGDSEALYEISERQVTDHQSEIKKMNVDMVWKDGEGNVEKNLNIVEGTREEYVLHLEASDYGPDGQFIGLREGSSGSFSFTGTLNANPNILWEDGEIIVHFDYEIVSAVEENRSEETGLVPERDLGVLGDTPDEEGEERKKPTVSSGDRTGVHEEVSGNDPLI